MRPVLLGLKNIKSFVLISLQTKGGIPLSIKYVFISATKTDLEDHRKVLIEALERSDDVKCLTMERFGPKPKPPVPQCLGQVEKSDLFVGLIGHYRGWEPEEDEQQRSITEMEYDHAVSLGKPIFMVVLPENQVTLKPCDREPDEKWERQQQFRKRINGDYVVEVVKFDPKDIAISVITSIQEYRDEKWKSKCKNLEDYIYRNQSKYTAFPEFENEQLVELKRLLTGEGVDLDEILKQGRSKNLDELIERFWEKAEQNRMQACGFYKYVGILAREKHTSKALESYKLAVKLEPRDADGWNQLGELQLRLGAFEEAKNSFQRVLALSNQE